MDVPANRGSAAEVSYSAVASGLGRRIVDGDLAAGQVLTLEMIQAEHDVSRTVAREAMRLLESLGLLVSRRRVGLTVQPAPAWNVYDARVISWRLEGRGRDAQLASLTELRVAVEPAAAAAAAAHASRAERAELLTTARRLRTLGEQGDLEEFMDVDVSYHSTVLTASGNEMFAALSPVVAVVLRGRTRLGLMPDRPVPQALALHEQVARAVADHDPGGAESAMRRLLVEVRGAVGRPEQA